MDLAKILGKLDFDDQKTKSAIIHLKNNHVDGSRLAAILEKFDSDDGKVSVSIEFFKKNSVNGLEFVAAFKQFEHDSARETVTIDYLQKNRLDARELASIVEGFDHDSGRIKVSITFLQFNSINGERLATVLKHFSHDPNKTKVVEAIKRASGISENLDKILQSFTTSSEIAKCVKHFNTIGSFKGPIKDSEMITTIVNGMDHDNEKCKVVENYLEKGNGIQVNLQRYQRNYSFF